MKDKVAGIISKIDKIKISSNTVTKSTINTQQSNYIHTNLIKY